IPPQVQDQRAQGVAAQGEDRVSKRAPDARDELVDLEIPDSPVEHMAGEAWDLDRTPHDRELEGRHRVGPVNLDHDRRPRLTPDRPTDLVRRLPRGGMAVDLHDAVQRPQDRRRGRGGEGGLEYE